MILLGWEEERVWISHDSLDWGYDGRDPVAEDIGFLDPLGFFEEIVEKSEPYEIVVATDSGTPLNLRMGPDGYRPGDTDGQRPGVNGDYTVVYKLLDTTRRFEVVGASPGTSNCGLGWVQIASEDDSWIDDEEADPPGKYKSVWACRGISENGGRAKPRVE